MLMIDDDNYMYSSNLRVEATYMYSQGKMLMIDDDTDRRSLYGVCQFCHLEHNSPKVEITALGTESVPH